MRLTEQGLLRWYASCCQTAVANTPANYRFSFVGLVHNCLEYGGVSMDASFGPVRFHVNTAAAKAKLPSNPLATISVIFRTATKLARARLTGSYKHTPFFAAETGIPVVTPLVLSTSRNAPHPPTVAAQPLCRAGASGLYIPPGLLHVNGSTSHHVPGNSARGS